MQKIIAGKDGCQGDSGGPLVAIGEEGETTLTGIVRCCWSLSMMAIMTMIMAMMMMMVQMGIGCHQ